MHKNTNQAKTNQQNKNKQTKNSKGNMISRTRASKREKLFILRFLKK